jgi:hypothetical protein
MSHTLVFQDLGPMEAMAQFPGLYVGVHVVLSGTVCTNTKVKAPPLINFINFHQAPQHIQNLSSTTYNNITMGLVQILPVDPTDQTRNNWCFTLARPQDPKNKVHELGTLIWTSPVGQQTVPVYSDSANLRNPNGSGDTLVDLNGQQRSLEWFMQSLCGTQPNRFKPLQANFWTNIAANKHTVRKMTIHSISWAGPPGQTTYRFMTCTIEGSHMPYPAFYFFRGDCVAILVIAVVRGGPKPKYYVLQAKQQRGNGNLEEECLAGMVADSLDSCKPQLVAAKEGEEEFALSSSIMSQMFPLFPPDMPGVRLSIGGCDERLAWYGCIFIEVTGDYIDAVQKVQTSVEEEGEAIQISVQEWDPEDPGSVCRFSDVKTLLGLWQFNSRLTTHCVDQRLPEPARNEKGCPLGREEVVNGLTQREDRLRASGKLQDANRVMCVRKQIQEIRR